MSSRVRPFAVLFPAVALLAVAPRAQAVEPLDTFSVHINGYVSKFDTKVRADGETSGGTRVDLHRDLGLDDSNILADIGLTWRPWEHHEFGLSYHADNNSVTRVIERDIEFNGTLYETASTIRATTGVDTYEAYYIWWAAAHDDWALGPRFGLVWYKMEVGLSLQIDANGDQVAGAVSDEVAADLPAPTIGGSWRWTPGEDWRISADAGYFTINVNNIDGDVYFGRIGVEWFPWERSGFSFDYTISQIKVDAEKNRFRGNLDFVDSGLRLGYVYRF